MVGSIAGYWSDHIHSITTFLRIRVGRLRPPRQHKRYLDPVALGAQDPPRIAYGVTTISRLPRAEEKKLYFASADWAPCLGQSCDVKAGRQSAVKKTSDARRSRCGASKNVPCMQAAATAAGLQLGDAGPTRARSNRFATLRSTRKRRPQPRPELPIPVDLQTGGRHPIDHLIPDRTESSLRHTPNAPGSLAGSLRRPYALAGQIGSNCSSPRASPRPAQVRLGSASGTPTARRTTMET